MKDPTKNFEQFLLSKHALNQRGHGCHSPGPEKEYIDVECSIGFNAKPMVVDTERELHDVYAEKS